MDLENGRESSAYSESYSEVTDGSRSSDNVIIYPRLRVREGSSDHLILIDSDNSNGSESSENSEPRRVRVIDGAVGSEHTEITITGGYTDGSVSSRHTESTVTRGGDIHLPILKISSSSSSADSSPPPPSSSDSSLYDLFDTTIKESAAGPSAFTSSGSADKPIEVRQPAASEDHGGGIPVGNFNKSKQWEDGSPSHIITSPASDISLESMAHNISPMQSPPVQVMERLEGYDPLRIPLSVFGGTKGPKPIEWSTASSESLFSIHVGHGSFSRDHALMLGDLVKSGELTKSGELIMLSPTLERAVAETDNQSAETEKDEANEVVDNTVKEPEDNRNEEKKQDQVVSWKTPSTSTRSYESGESTRSFSFPIRKRICECPSCYCSDCSWALCYCTCLRCFRWPSCHFRWPSCHFRWPSCSCSCCSRAFCYNWNCCRKRSLVGAMSSGSLKTDAQQKEHDLNPLADPVRRQKSSSYHWFHCFSCCSWGCSCCSRGCSWGCSFTCCRCCRCCRLSKCC